MSLELSRLSRDIGIQIGLLISRRGTVEFVIAGTGGGISIPELYRRRIHPGRLQGLRLIHTHLSGEGLTSEDLTDLAKLRLDMVYAITVKENGDPGLAYGAYLIPSNGEAKVWKTLEPTPTYRIDIPFDTFISSLEEEIARSQAALSAGANEDRAILVAVVPSLSEDAKIAISEFQSLARSAGITVMDTVVQRRPKPDPKYVVGKGKVLDIYIRALAVDANILIFDHELSPSQARSISDIVDMRVIDRTQLILDIFARRAKTKEGKIQVELAQLRYYMPRLVGRNPSLSRLAGGIGTRGPGESKLEIDRRKAKDRMTRLEKEAQAISRKRRLTRMRRQRSEIPVISIIGYTNTGKSTLLNSLTKSSVLTADMPFATLDPSSKRLRFPRDIEVIITDTVGFIRDLPQDLRAAFMATLEELEDANLLLEVIDLTDPHMDYRMQAVDDILSDLHLEGKPRLKVFNKADRCPPDFAETVAGRYGGVAVSALDRSTLRPLIEKMEAFFLNARSRG
ncbi:MAG TPA: GTPase HflX [Deltaproteobacteria bacterium]|nr:GTPase HflX [Deltaproteobacteria bacterium]HQH99746.1 GTPase HflX [Deltaproteobacteria bacterium]